MNAVLRLTLSLHNRNSYSQDGKQCGQWNDSSSDSSENIQKERHFRENKWSALGEDFPWMKILNIVLCQHAVCLEYRPIPVLENRLFENDTYCEGLTR